MRSDSSPPPAGNVPETPDARRIEQYWLGQLSPHETPGLAQWLDQVPGRRERYDAIGAALKGRRFPGYTDDARDARVAELMQHTVSVVSPQSLSRRPWLPGGATGPMRQMATQARLAVTAACVVGMAVAAIQFAPHTTYDGVGSRTTRYTSAPGQRIALALRDGAQVVLGPATTVLVRRTGNALDVSVEGEAWFSVAHRTDRPLTVRAGAAVGTVLGTSFLVRWYPHELSARVTVAEGRVALRDSSEHATPVVLSARTSGTVSQDGNVGVTERALTESDTAWVDGRLVFQNVPLRDVVAELSRAYGASITLADSSLSDRRVTYTAALSTHSLRDVLDVIAPIANAHYAPAERGFVLHAGRRTPRVRPAVPHPLSSPEEIQYGK